MVSGRSSVLLATLAATWALGVAEGALAVDQLHGGDQCSSESQPCHSKLGAAHNVLM